jgi:hypothetical protein
MSVTKLKIMHGKINLFSYPSQTHTHTLMYIHTHIKVQCDEHYHSGHGIHESSEMNLGHVARREL